MPPSEKQPIRMCIQCRSRFPQSGLLRIQCTNGTVTTYTGFGRSMYVCSMCQQLEATIKHLKGRCKAPKNAVDEFTQKLRETLTNG